MRADRTETGRLLRAYHDRGDASARDRLVEAYMPLVETIAQRHRGGGEEIDDLVQAGSIGLIKAIDRFKFDRGQDLSAYAVPNIEGEIKRHLRDTASSVKVPRRLQETSALVRRTGADLAARLGRAPTAAEIALELGRDEEEITSALESDRARVTVPFPKGDEESEAEGGDGDTVLLSEDRLTLAGAFHVLDEDERRIVYMRFISGASRSEAARELGISQRQLSRRLSQALAKLRAELENGENVKARNVEAAAAGKQSSAQVAAGEVERFLELPYHILLTRDEEGEGSRWRAEVEELPGCEAEGNTPDDAARGISRAMEQWISQALATGAKVPEPRSKANSSGRLLLRMPRGLHAELAHHADREEVSLNGFITGLLAAAVGWQSAGRGALPEARRVAEPPPRRSRFLSTAILVNIVVMAVAAIAAITLLILAWQHGW